MMLHSLQTVRGRKLHNPHLIVSSTSYASGQLIIVYTSIQLSAHQLLLHHLNIKLQLPQLHLHANFWYFFYGSAIIRASSIKILGFIFTSILGWHEQAQAVCSKVARKLLVLQRIGGTHKIHRFGHNFIRHASSLTSTSACP